MIALAAGIVIVAALAVWVLIPLLEGRQEGRTVADDVFDRLLEQKQAAYQAILDLEADHALGKVADEDLLILRRQHEREALAALRALDQAGSEDPKDDLLEREIAAARRRLRGR